MITDLQKAMRLIESIVDLDKLSGLKSVLFQHMESLASGMPVSKLELGDSFFWEDHYYMIGNFGNTSEGLVDVVRDDGRCDTLLEETRVEPKP